MSEFKYTTLDTFSTLDGPGIRSVIFLFGCPNRCIYCHNPENFTQSQCKTISFEDIEKMYNTNLSYYGENGGLTFSGGEPLLSATEILDFINTSSTKMNICLETSGSVFLSPQVSELLKRANYVLIDLKFNSDEDYQKYVGSPIENTLKTIEFMDDNNISYHIRHVVVPSINDDVDSLRKLLQLIFEVSKCRKVEFLPYHDMGVEKYHKLNIPYLLNVPSLDRLALVEMVDEVKEEFSDFDLVV